MAKGIVQIRLKGPLGTKKENVPKKRKKLGCRTGRKPFRPVKKMLAVSAREISNF